MGNSLVVWKFPLPAATATVEMPQWSKVLHFGLDPASDCPAVWALVNPEAEKESRKFVVVGTGTEVPKESVYVASLIDGPLVWHLFDASEITLLSSMLGAFK